jgi:heparanase 1
MATYLESKYSGKTPGFAYSVGNEPELWSQRKVSVAQLARDAVTMVDTLKGFNIGRDVYGSSFARISPEDASAFLPIAAAGGVRGLTVHSYPYGGHDCNVSAYLQKGPVVAGLAGKLAAVRAVRDAVAPGMLLVLEEVAGSSGGGCENVTDRFVAGFAWLTTLATVGAAGFQRLHRQDIAGWSFAFGMSHYMLVGPAGWTNGSHAALTPHPDYYTALLWRQLVGRRVLNTSLAGADDYAFGSIWCAASGAPYGAGGSVVLAWTNSAPEALRVALPPVLASARFAAFTLTATASGQAGFGDLASDAAFLNGQLLAVDEAGVVQGYPFAAPSAPAADALTAPPFSYGFVVFDTAAADVPACAT